MWQLHLPDESATKKFGHELGAAAQVGDVLVLTGELGVGKTVLVKGLAAALDVEAHMVTSPTFSLVNEYVGRLPVVHMDLYRLDDPGEFESIGGLEYVDRGDSVVVIEWGERIAAAALEAYVQVQLAYLAEQAAREAVVTARGAAGEAWLDRVRRAWNDREAQA